MLRVLEQNYAICKTMSKYKTTPLACFWDLVEMKCLNMGHKASMLSKVPIMIWVLSELLSHKLRWPSNNPL